MFRIVGGMEQDHDDRDESNCGKKKRPRGRPRPGALSRREARRGVRRRSA